MIQETILNNYKIIRHPDGFSIKIPLCAQCGASIENAAELGGPICYECFINLPEVKYIAKDQKNE